MNTTNYHITKREDGNWQYKREGAQKASGIVSTQNEAERLAKELLGKGTGGEVVIHGVDGKIRDKDTVKPAVDPNPPKDSVH
ncbi:MAG: Uncharacterized protein XD93_0365 [candidate division WS6 bacterium 34_10]|jgi:uncharacterized protein YdaT|uniref:DUF2188 domain-containing protein n=1 Tax=candidate division WS6 bacterium 34_10 TaxID=1641389 RepID=A0A101HID7_9BACT|nr:MAG: Uncharacterized protein XD93_0365 [candidate division WS6 bacterium 34_10]